MAVGDVAALRTLFKAVLADEPWLRDPLVAEMPWREDVYEATRKDAARRQLVVGIAPTDGLVTPQPPILRAVETVASALRDAGHVVIPFSPRHSDTKEAIDLWSAAAYADLTFAHVQFRASGEVVDPLMPPAFDPDKITQNAPLGTDEVQRVNVRIRKYREAYLRRWGETATYPGNTTGRPVDVMITPIAPYSAVRIGKVRYIGEYLVPTSALLIQDTHTLSLCRGSPRLTFISTQAIPSP
jgi:amidase